MIQLVKKEVFPEQSEELLAFRFSDASELENLKLASGSWTIENGMTVLTKQDAAVVVGGYYEF